MSSSSKVPTERDSLLPTTDKRGGNHASKEVKNSVKVEEEEDDDEEGVSE
jgi:hypothetical protein